MLWMSPEGFLRLVEAVHFQKCLQRQAEYSSSHLQRDMCWQFCPESRGKLFYFVHVKERLVLTLSVLSYKT